MNALTRPTLLLLATALLVAVAFAACDDDSLPDGIPTLPTATDDFQTTPPSQGGEAGTEPVFWRTADDFESVRAGEAYKVLFRITSGYAEPTLTVTAECASCALPSERQPVEFVAEKAQPQGEEAPGSYYPLNLVLPFAGTWQLHLTAASTDTTISFEVQPSEPASG